MAVEITGLPEQTDYSWTRLSFANELTPPLGGPTTRLQRPGTRHALNVSVPAIDAAECGAGLLADLALGEISGVVIDIPEPGISEQDYGAPRVNGAGFIGMVLPIDGLPAGAVVPKGKWLSVIVNGQRYAHFTTAEVTANGSGQVSLPIFPMVRRPAPDNAVVELAQPKLEGLPSLSPEWSVQKFGAAGMISIDFTVTESE